MEVPAERVGEGLRFVVIVETGEVAPAGIVAKFYESGTHLCAEEHPAKDDDGNDRRPGVRRAEEDGEESGFEEHGFPAEAEEVLADVDDGEIEHVKDYPG